MVNFVGLAAPMSPTGLNSVCNAIGVDAATTWSVLSVETKSCGFLGNRKPQILFERHVFHRLTNGQYDASNPDVSNSVPGGYDLPASDQYTRLDEALALDEASALKSASWGIGQIMGTNASLAGFTDVYEMIAAFISGEDAQLQGMAQFVLQSNLAPSLASRSWAAFANGYNGPSYSAGGYDTKLSRAYSLYTTGQLPDPFIRGVQIALMLLEPALFSEKDVDGIYGRVTQAAIVAYQASKGLSASGTADAATVTALCADVGWPQI